MNFSRVILTSAWLLLGATVLSAQTNDPANYYYKQGYGQLERAEKGRSQPDRIAALEAARIQFEKALEIQPNHYRARALFAQTLFGLVKETPDSGQRNTYVTETRHQFALAAKLPDADWRIASAWGRFLTYIATDLATNDADRVLNLTEAQEKFAKATSEIHLTTDRAYLQNTYGQCLYQLALLTRETTTRDRRLHAAINCFSEAAQALPALVDGPALQTWGAALLALSQTERTPAVITQALERLEEAVVIMSDPAPIQYDLARAHALLGQPVEALRQFRQSLQSSQAENLLTRARQEPDFVSLRERADFLQLLNPAHATPDHDRLIREAAQEMTFATQGGLDSWAVEHRQKAVEKLRQALQALPESYVAQLLLGENLGELSRRSIGRVEQERMLREAQTAFATASALPQADSRALAAWGQLLLTTADEGLATPTERAGWYAAAAEKFAAGVKAATYTGERQQLAREQAISLVSLARLQAAAKDRQRLFEQAMNIFAEVTGKPQPAIAARSLQYWGIALTELGKLQNDRMRTRQGTERLLTALELAPTNLATRLELARAYVVLGQNDQALRHLVLCLEQEPARTKQWVQAAGDDLTPLRVLPEFNAKFVEPSSGQ